MRTIITIALVSGFALAAAVASFWTTSLPAGSPLRGSAIDPHGLTLKTKNLPAQEIADFY